jgi:hypothetical protein
MGQVSTLEVLPVAQGKRLQTGTCRTFTEKIYVDVREEQSWTLPGGGQMLNLYQRQCLTLDRHSIITHLDTPFTCSLLLTSLGMRFLAFARRYG